MKIDRKYICFLILVAAAFLVYGPSLKGGFVLDDIFVIRDNMNIRTLNIPLFFSSDYWAGSRYEGESSALYRPLVIFSYALDYALWKLNPLGYRLVNLVLHAANGILIFYLALLVLSEYGTAFLIALLFVAHPVHVEAVSGIVGRSELMATFFFLAALIACAKGKKYSIPALVFFTLALFTKEIAITLPAVIMLYDLARFHGMKSVMKKIKYYLYYIIPILTYFAARFLALGVIVSPQQKGYFYQHDTATRLLTMSRVLVSYMRMLFYPLGLRQDYSDFPFSSSFDPAVAFSIGLLAFVLCLGYAFYRRKSILFLAIYWFVLTILPVSNIVPFGALLAERFLYLPSVGFCLLFGAGRMKGKEIAAVSCIIIFFSLCAMKYSLAWKSNETLWNAAIRKAPSNARLHYAMGTSFLDRNDYDRAIEEFEKSVAIDPDIPESYNNMAVCFFSKNMFDRAIESSCRAIRLKYNYMEAYVNLGNAFGAKGMYKEAEDAYRKAIEVNPAYVDAYFNLGLLLYGEKRGDEAMLAFLKAGELNPYLANAWSNAGTIYMERKDYNKAIEMFGKAVRASPGNASFHNQLGLSLFYAARYDEAISAFRQALFINPSDAFIHNSLGSVYGMKKMYGEALKEFGEAVRLKPDYAEAKSNYERLGQFMGVK